MNDTIYGCTNCQRLHNTLIKCQEANQKFLLKIKRLKAKQLPNVDKVEKIINSFDKSHQHGWLCATTKRQLAHKIMEGMK